MRLPTLAGTILRWMGVVIPKAVGHAIDFGITAVCALAFGPDVIGYLREPFPYPDMLSVQPSDGGYAIHKTASVEEGWIQVFHCDAATGVVQVYRGAFTSREEDFPLNMQSVPASPTRNIHTFLTHLSGPKEASFIEVFDATTRARMARGRRDGILLECVEARNLLASQ